MRHIDYIPRDELYDLCLAKLMDEYGGDISREEALSVLKNLWTPLRKSKTAMTKKLTVLRKTSLKRQSQSLLKVVLDPGEKGGRLECASYTSFQNQRNILAMNILKKD